MKTARGITCGGVLLALVAACAAFANAPGGGQEDSSAEAAPVVTFDLSEARDRAGKMPIDRRNDIDKRIAATVARVNNTVTNKGQAAVATRLATEFGITTEALLAEKGEHGLSWGEIMIAHTLLANSSEGGVTLVDLVDLRSEGLSWGAIAFGLRFHIEDLEEAIKAEGRVAMGLSKPGGTAAANVK